ncbi:NAD-dependent epimerase/dehydratase family protein [Candidatus Pelagibacter sp.]|uniref:NAD-dependent epimerase/dehydratase family protein n=1 Tax=Candidatus Pelagibacter sp. TaxID=2024849 RepID=UPI003F83A6B4
MKNKKKILITGGNGYIGSCLAFELKKKFLISVVDKASPSEFLPKDIKYHKINLLRKNKLLKLLTTKKPDIIIHLAGQSTIDMVEKKKDNYYLDNFLATKNLIECIKKLKVSNLIFSSTAAVYKQKIQKLNEKSTLYSKNAYGLSKIKCESEVKSLDNSKSKYCILRFFNVASSIVKSQIGEFHNPETHLIPLIIHSTLNKKSIRVYGKNYKTKDGTCLRDYIHILDIVRGIEKSIRYLLKKNSKNEIFNLGSGVSYSVKEVIDCSFKILKKNTEVKYLQKRKHDSSKLVCDIQKAKNILDWEPLYSNIDKIIRDEIWWFNHLKKNNKTRKFIY